MDERPDFWQRLQKIDSRVLYVLLLLSILIPLFSSHFRLGLIPSQQSRDFFNTVEEVSTKTPEKLVIVDGIWSPSSRGENQWQTRAIMTHLMERHQKFAILSFDSRNNTLMQQIAAELGKKYGYGYGRDYINWGFRVVMPQTIKGFATSIPATLKKDYQGQPLASFPIMQGVKNWQQIGAIIEITPAGTADTWIGLAPVGKGPDKVPFLYAPTAVMAPTYYPYIDSGQISGMLAGIKGAGDYEQMLHDKYHSEPSFGTRATGALSLVYALIVFFIVLGNVGYYQTRVAKRSVSE